MGASRMGASQGDWHFQPAYRLLQALEQGKTSSAELVDYFQTRAQAHNPALNAIVDQDFGAAKAQAEAADAARKRGESWGPLHGLPMTIKDALEVAGMKAVGGAPVWLGRQGYDLQYSEHTDHVADRGDPRDHRPVVLRWRRRALDRLRPLRPGLRHRFLRRLRRAPDGPGFKSGQIP